jgi:glycosyltransferase involved in cell wall biosynthesis
VKGSKYHLDIIGWPSDEELGKLNAYRVSYKVYNGLTDTEVYERYKACDIMYNASFYEGFGMPIIEAQSVGRPVITSNIGAMKEVAKESAVLVDPHNPDEIRAAIDRLVTDRNWYDEITERGRANIAPYQYESIAAQYLQVYNELAAKNNWYNYLEQSKKHSVSVF